jgi:hypothetical protein
VPLYWAPSSRYCAASEDLVLLAYEKLQQVRRFCLPKATVRVFGGPDLVVQQLQVKVTAWGICPRLSLAQSEEESTWSARREARTHDVDSL